MTKPTIHGVRRAVSASSVLDALAEDLSRIRLEDKLTWGDVGRVLGKSDDQAAKYGDGTAEMGVTAYAFGKKEWNGRFTGSLDRLVEGARGDRTTDRQKECSILRAALELSAALEDGVLTDEEIRANRPTLETARESIEALLQRIAPKAVRG